MFLDFICDMIKVKNFAWSIYHINLFPNKCFVLVIHILVIISNLITHSFQVMNGYGFELFKLCSGAGRGMGQKKQFHLFRSYFKCLFFICSPCHQDHKEEVTCVSFNGGDSYIASGSTSGDIILHSITTNLSSKAFGHGPNEVLLSLFNKLLPYSYARSPWQKYGN